MSTSTAERSRRRRAAPRRTRPTALLDGSPPLTIDASWLISLYIVVLMFIPANLTISAIGSMGTPALLLGLGALLLWAGVQMTRSLATLTPPQPIRRLMLLFALAVVISFVAATTRPIEGFELSGADRGLLLIAAWLGIVLLTADGLIGLDRLEAPLRVLVMSGGLVALIGIVQFVTGDAIVDVVQIPGLTPNTQLTSIYDRGGFTRAAGTSTHPIEFGVVLAMILPVALHFAFADTHRGRFARWFPVATIALAIPITISRSAIVGVVVALVVLMPTWPPARRRISYLVIAALLTGIYVAIPGMLGTLTRLFTGISSDGSALSRTDSYALAFDFIKDSPIVGRGLGTFLPQYRILDNQYLGLLIEVGILGTGLLLMLFVTAMWTAVRTRAASTDPRARGIAQALLAMVAAGATTFATFDAFGFPQASSLVFLGIGFIGALANTARRQALGENPRTVKWLAPPLTLKSRAATPPSSAQAEL